MGKPRRKPISNPIDRANQQRAMQQPVSNSTTDLPAHYMEHRVEMSYQSPYPPPAVIDALEQHAPGATDRLLTMVEKNLEHQHGMQREDMRQYYEVVKQDQKSDAEITKRGQTMSPIMVGSFCLVAIAFAYLKYPAEGMWTFGLTFAGVVGIAMWGRFQSTRSRKIETKDEQGPDKPETQTKPTD